jgi:hypothetical protein
VVQRHMCHSCHHTYSEGSALLIRGSWYAREVHRCAIDYWQHLGTSLRRTAEVVRSWLGKQERYLLWRPLEAAPAEADECHPWPGQAFCQHRAPLAGSGRSGGARERGGTVGRGRQHRHRGD